jgi:hypothetical protein
MKLGKNIKLLQSEIKILECDWSENYRIQENTTFLCEIEKEYKITPIRDKNFRV